MKMKLMLAATAIAAMTGMSYAQESGASDMSKNSPTDGAMYTSPEEQAMFENNADYIGGFFTDETMTELMPEDGMQTAWASLSDEQREQLRSDCEAAEMNRVSYGDVSLTLCSQLGAFE